MALNISQLMQPYPDTHTMSFTLESNLPCNADSLLPQGSKFIRLFLFYASFHLLKEDIQVLRDGQSSFLSF